MSGWIKLHRQIQGHWLWLSEKPFDKRSAWIDILLMVNHEDKTVLLGNDLVEVKRGERLTSEPKLAERWGWSRTKVRNFLNLLEKDGMIENKKEGRKRTRLKVLNYSIYQGSEDSEKTSKKQVKNNERTSREQAENINKNDKNDKNIDDDEESAEKNPYVFYEHNFGTISPFIAERIKALEDDIGSAMVVEAMKIASLNRAKGLGYVETIVKDWLAKNIRDPSQIGSYKEQTNFPPKQPINQKTKEVSEDEIVAAATYIEIELNEFKKQKPTRQQIKAFLNSNKFAYSADVKRKAFERLGLSEFLEGE